MAKKDTSCPSTYCTLREMMMLLSKVAAQHPTLIDRPLVFVDKTTNKSRFLAHHHCDDAGFTEGAPPQFGMTPAVVIEELR